MISFKQININPLKPQLQKFNYELDLKKKVSSVNEDYFPSKIIAHIYSELIPRILSFQRENRRNENFIEKLSKMV